MPQEVVRLQISVAGDDKAISALQSLDQLADRLNKTPIKLNIDTSNLAAMEKQVSASLNQITKNINAQARLLEAKNQEANINAKLEQSANQRATAEAKVAAEAEKTRQAIEKTAQAQAKVQEAQVKAFETEAKIAIETEKSRQAAEKTAQAQAKVEAVEQRRQLLAEQMSAAQEKATAQAKAYSDAVEKTANTPLQDQIDALTGVSNGYKSAADSAKVFEEAASRARLEIEKKVGRDTGNIFDLSKGTNGMRDYIKNVEGIQNATVAATRTVEAGGRTFQQFSVSARNASGDIGNMTISVDTATGSVHKLDQGMSSTNKTAGMLKQSLGDIVSEFGKWYIIGNIFSSITTSISEAVQELKNVDSELVNIQKVMGATAGEMEELSSKAYEVGSALGVAASDYLASVNKWAQAGYGSLSDELGELSVRTQKVGDVQEETANQFLLSVDAAYQYKGNIEALTRVLDGANEISNNYATSVEKLAGGMGIVSSLAAQAGMEVQETMAAIGTITAVTQESGNSAARALRALILNIQGSTEIAIDDASGERWTEDEIEATAAALGDLNIATREYKDGVEQLRNPMEVIGELSEKYRKGLINEVQLQEVVSSLGGKVRSNQLQALITNYDMYEEMLQTYNDSVGSADRELDIYLNSWEAKTNRLKNQWVELVESFKASDISKGILDIGNALLSVANSDLGPIIIQIGLLTAAVTALSVAYANLAKTKGTSNIVDTLADTKVITAIKAFITDVKAAPAAIKGMVSAIAGGGGLTGALKALTTSITGTVGVVGIAIAAVATLIAIWDMVNVTTQEHIDNAEKAKSEYEEATSTLETLNTQLENNKKAIEALNDAGPLTLTDQADIDRLKTENSLLATQIDLEKERQRISAKKSFDEYYGALEQEKAPVMGTSATVTISGTSQIDSFIGKIKELEAEIESLGSDEKSAKRREKLEKEVDNYREQLNEVETLFLNTYDAAITAAEYGDEEAAKFIQDYGDVLDTIQIFADRAGWTIDQIDELANSSKDFAAALEQVKADGSVTIAEVNNLLSAFPELQTEMDKSGFTARDLAEHLTAVAQSEHTVEEGANGASDGLSEFEAEAEALSETLSSLESALSTLESAQEELSEHGELSVGTIDSLIQRFPELTDLMLEWQAGLVSEQELQQALSEQYNKSANDYKRSIVEKMLSNEEFYKNTILTNTEIVSKLAELGITDLENYQTLEELKEEVNRRIQEEMTKNAKDGKNDREQIYGEEAATFAKLQGAMLASQKLVIDKMLPTKPKSLTDILNQQNGINPDELEYYDFGTGRQPNGSISQSALDSYWDEVMDILSSAIEIPSLSFDTPSSSSGSSSSSSTKSWYEEQIENLQNLISETQDTNTLLEKEEADSYAKRISNLQAMQNRVHDMANQFRARGLSDTSNEVKQLKLMYHDLADEIEAVYQSMYDDLMEEHADRQWNLDLFEKNRENADRSVEEITEDCQKVVSEYKSMQQEVADLAAYYRSMGYDETDDLIQDLSDAWWDYQEQIESVYDALSDAFEDYISESDRQIHALERTTGTAGQQIEIYTQRILEAQKAIQALQATNINGINDDRIGNIQDQIYSDQDAIENIQNDLWDELVNAVDKEFDKWQDKIDEAQDKLDDFNQKVADLDEELQEIIDPLQEQIEDWEKELEDALDDPAWEFFNESLRNSGMSINEAIEKYTDAIEAEQEALEEATDPLRKQIEGYYTVNPDGTIGEYVPGLEDKRDDWQDLLDAENERWQKEQEQHDEDQALAKKQLALTEAIKNLEQAQLDLETARNERTVYTLKDGVWAWRPDDQAIQEAEEALEDAEQAKDEAKDELDWLELERAHDKLADFYEKQAQIEQDKIDELNKQIDALERESEARQDYLNDQLDLWEDEKEAWEDHYNDLIERNEDEIEAWEEYYEKKKEQYDDDIAEWTARVEELQAKYDAWMERWEDIQDAIQEPARSIAEILDDIAKYGTPAMRDEINNIVGLLEEMGVALGDFNSSIGDSGSGGNTSGGSSYQDIIDQMRENALAWQEAMDRGDQNAADYYYGLNQSLGASIGATFNPGSGKWYDSNGNLLFQVPTYTGGSSGSSSGGSSRPSGGGSSSGSSGSGGYSSIAAQYADDIARMEANSQYYEEAKASGDDAKADFYYQWNQRIGAGIPGAYFNSGSGVWYGPDDLPLFDKGGLAVGKGIMVKDVEEPELVLNPEQTKALLTTPVLADEVLKPVRDYDKMAQSMGIMYGGNRDLAPDTRMERNMVVNNVDSHNVGAIINGVELGENMLDRPLSEILSLLGIHRDY